MNVQSLLRKLEAELKEGGNIPFSSKQSVDVDACLDILQQIQGNLPEAIAQSELIVREKQQILQDAEMEAEAMIQDAQHAIAQMVEEHAIALKARQMARDIINNAQEDARQIRTGARSYAEQVLTDLEREVQSCLAELRRNKDELRGNRR